MKLYFSLLTLFACLFLFSNRLSAQEKSDVLIPYLKNGKWGLCTKDKAIKVIPIYDNVNLEAPYFFAVKNNAIKALDLQGRVIDSFQQFLRLGKDSFLCFSFSGNYDSSAIFTNNPNLMQFDTSFNVRLLHDNKSIRFVDGTVDALITVKSISPINQSESDFLFVNHNGKTGLYDIRENYFAILPKYTKYHVINDNIVIAQDENGQMETWDLTVGKLKNNSNYLDENVTEIWSNGNYVRAASGQGEKSWSSIQFKWDLLAPSGKVLLSACQSLNANAETGIISCIDTLNSSFTPYSLYDFNGKLLLKGVRKFDYDFKNLLSIYGPGYEQFIGLYNFKLHKFVWENNYPASVKVKLFRDMPLPRIEVDTMTYFIDDQGNKLLTLGNYNRYYAKAFQLMKNVNIYKPKMGNQTFKEQKYTAIRPNINVPFSIYDENYRKIEKMDDFLGNDNQVLYAFKKNKKWGLANWDSVIIQPIYDSIRITKSYRNFLMTKDNRRYIYLSKVKKLLPADGYDDAIGYSGHNCFLGIKYLDTFKRGEDWRWAKQLKCRLDLMDSTGKVLYSTVVNPEFNLDYALTKNNKIIELAEDNRYNYFYVYDPSEDTTVRIEKKFAGFETFQDLPVVIKFRNKDGSLELLNANDLKPINYKVGQFVFPDSASKKSAAFFSDFQDNGDLTSFSSRPVQFSNGSDTLNCLALMQNTKTPNPDYLNPKVLFTSQFSSPFNREHKVIGYISVDGVLYVD